MKIAVISDAHGNSFALEAVLQDIAAEQPDLIINLGDLVSGPFDPARSADLQISLKAVTIAGNHERQILSGATGISDSYARARLSDTHLNWLKSLPTTQSLLNNQVFACHGSPAGGDLDYCLENISSGSPALDTVANIAPRLKDIGPATLLLCGHTHIPRVAVINGITIVNPGSIGMPAYRDTQPVPHAIEAGSPHARYALIRQTPHGWSTDLRAIPYNHESAAQQAENAGRPDIAYGVRTGRTPF